MTATSAKRRTNFSISPAAANPSGKHPGHGRSQLPDFSSIFKKPAEFIARMITPPHAVADLNLFKGRLLRLVT